MKIGGREFLASLMGLSLMAGTGCRSLHSHLNQPLREDRVAPDCRASLEIQQPRGSEDVLVILCLSGGGSRAAWFSAATMLRLERIVDEINLLHEVDVISSVSGGSLPAAYYCVTRDPGPYSVVRVDGLPDRLPPELERVVKVDRRRGLLGVRGQMSEEQRDRLRPLFESHRDQARVEHLYWLSTHTRAPAIWQPQQVRELMTRDYIKQLLIRSFSPLHLGEDLRYWMTAYDRSDQMADIFKRNMFGAQLVKVPQAVKDAAELDFLGHFDRPVASGSNSNHLVAAGQPGDELRWPAEESPATLPRLDWIPGYKPARKSAQFIASSVVEGAEYATRDFRHVLPYRFKDLNPERPYLVLNATNGTEDDAGEPHMGQVFTFTRDDFQRLLGSSIDDYPVAWGVMASAAFPGAFSYITLRDYRPAPESSPPRYMHMFDGGNTDNLGLTTARRIILANRDRYRHFVVIVVDSHVPSPGASRAKPDVRTKVVDVNFMNTFGSLLDQVRRQNLAEFNSGYLDGQNLTDKLTFWHITFQHLADEELKAKANRIPTSFLISRENAAIVDQCVNELVRADQPKLQEILRVLRVSAKPAPSQPIAGPVSTPATKN